MNPFIEWENNEGQKIMSIIGVKANDTVLDFGCGKGYYSFAASKTVGEKGHVIALDKSKLRMQLIKRRVKRESVANIECVLTDGSLELPIEKESVDIVFIYDIMHHFKGDKRALLLKEIRRILKPDGILTVHPAHEFEDGKTPEELMAELVLFGFEHIGNLRTRLIHFRAFEESTIYNFAIIK